MKKSYKLVRRGIKVLLTAMAIMFAVNAGAFAQQGSENEDDEPYLSDADEDAILDTNADDVMEDEIEQEREADIAESEEAQEEAESEEASSGEETDEAEESEEGEGYIVRVEIYARPSTPYIPVGELSLKDGFFYWCHDGKKQNGYAVFMYPTDEDESQITVTGKGAYCIYAKSFDSVEAASQEIQGPDTDFSGYITYKPVVDQMLEKLQKSPYQEEEIESESAEDESEEAVDEGDTDEDENAADMDEDAADEGVEEVDASVGPEAEEDDGTEPVDDDSESSEEDDDSGEDEVLDEGVEGTL